MLIYLVVNKFVCNIIRVFSIKIYQNLYLVNFNLFKGLNQDLQALYAIIKLL